MNHKRKKRRQSVRCRICTPFRWLGNAKGRWPHRDEKRMEERDFVWVRWSDSQRQVAPVSVSARFKT